jgi:pimeloyl-ACP methyl ester carboxylesterase
MPKPNLIAAVAGLLFLVGAAIFSPARPTASDLSGLTNLTGPTNLIATPTPNPAQLAAAIEQLTTQVQALQTQIADLQAQISKLQSFSTQLSNLPPANLPTGRPCPNDSDFTCYTLTVPLDHFDPTNPQTLEVVFGLRPADGRRKGMLVIATGGPGSSGLAAADSYAASYDPAILEQFDLVFFDQRGVGASGGLQCPQAVADYYQTETDTQTPAGEAAAVAAAQTFAAACVSELDQPDLLPYLTTRQAVADLEAFRQAVGDDKYWLYGESYGTQYAQTYAAAYPDHLAGLILDGVVDLTLSGPEFLRQQTQAFNDVLLMTLQACNADADCAAEMGRDAVAVYDDLAAQLKRGPRRFTFPLPSGGTAEREFTFTDLEIAAASYLYSETQRMMLQRALAAAERDDLTPLARLLYDSLSLNPETLQPISDPTFSDAVYYGVECMDYDYDPTTDPAQNAKAYIRAGDPVDQSVPRLSSIFYGDLPCVFWPTLADSRPEPLLAEGIPTLVLGATADPATPVNNGRQVYSRLAYGYLVTTTGGPHVTFGWGNPCPDDLVTAFLVEDKMPRQPETECEGVVADAYVPWPPADARHYADPLEALLAADTEIYYLPEYYYWDTVTPTSVGCPYGGRLTFAPGDEGDEFTMEDCAFLDGFKMTGTGLYDTSLGSFSLDVSVTGPDGVTGDLRYGRNENGAISVTGEYDGEKVELSEE